MTPKQVLPILQTHFRDDKLRLKSIYLEGASGIGKSDMIRELCAMEGIELRDKRLSQMDSVDLIGVPRDTEDGHTRWSPPDWLRFDPESKGVLLLDEVTSASREVMAAAYQLFLDREVNGVRIPPRWLVVACGNRVSDRGVVNQLPAPLLNRFLKLSVEPDLDSWVDWAGARGVDERVIGWILYQPEYLHNFSSETASDSFCSPRSITSAADYVGWPDAERVELLRGCLGKAGASALESYLRLVSFLPALTEVLANPEGCRIPDAKALGERYATAMMCSSNMDRTNFDALWRYVDRLGSMFVVLAVKLAFQRDKSLGTAKGYNNFAAKHQAVFAR